MRGGLGATSAGVGCAPSLSQIAAVMDCPDLLPPYLVPGGNHVQRARQVFGRRLEEERSCQEAGAVSAPRRAPPHHGVVRADRCSFLSPLTVTAALVPLCRLSGASDRISPLRGRETEEEPKQLIQPNQTSGSRRVFEICPAC